LRSERPAALRDVPKQPSINLAALHVCALGASYPKLSSWQKSHFRSIRLGERKKHSV